MELGLFQEAPFRAYVAAVDQDVSTVRPSKANLFGGILYESPVVRSAGDSDVAWQEFTFETGGLQLVGGEDYMIFVGIYGLLSEVDGQLRTGFLSFDSDYLDGRFYYDSSNEDSIVRAFNRDWLDIYNPIESRQGQDLAFRAVFTAIPEPSVHLLLHQWLKKP